MSTYRSRSTSVPFKRLRTIEWDTDTWQQAHHYLQTGELPRVLSRSQAARFRRKMSWLELEPGAAAGAGNRIVLRDGHRVYRVVPLSDVPSVLSRAWSDVKTNGFRGVNSFYDRLARETLGITKAMVRDFVRNQEVQQIQVRSVPEKRPRVVKPLRPERPFHWWQMDLVDMSKYAHWNGSARYLMTVIDIFSKFLYVKPLKQKTAELVAEALQEILLADGSPEILQSDNGPEFVNDLMTTLAQRWSMRLKHSQPYKPNTQGGVERANQTIKYAVFKYLRQHDTKRYLDVLPFLVLSYNTAVHSSTGYTPFDLHRGRDFALSVLSEEMGGIDAGAGAGGEAAGDGELESEAKTGGDVEAEAGAEEEEEKLNEQFQSVDDAASDEQLAPPRPLPSPIEYKRRWREQAEETNERVGDAKKRINARADKMMEQARTQTACANKEARSDNKEGSRSSKRRRSTASDELRPLHVGDAVRVAFMALASGRKRAAGKGSGADLPHWTPDVYHVSRIWHEPAGSTSSRKGDSKQHKSRTSNATEYAVEDEEGRGPKGSRGRSRFFRHELLRIDEAKLQRAGRTQTGNDLHFVHGKQRGVMTAKPALSSENLQLAAESVAADQRERAGGSHTQGVASVRRTLRPHKGVTRFIQIYY